MRMDRLFWKLGWCFIPGGPGAGKLRRPDLKNLSYEEKLATVTRIYQRKKVQAAVLHIIVAIGYLVVMLLFLTKPLRAALVPVADRVSFASDTLLVVLYTFVFFLLYRVVSFPLHYLSDFKLEHEFLLSRETFGQWLARDAKTFVLSQALIVVLVGMFYHFLRATGNRWWIYAAVAYVAFGIVVGKLFPVLVLPLFYKREPLRHEGVVERVKALAARAHFNVSQVCSFNLSKETQKVAAALVGLGRNRQILISDTLLSHFTVDEIEAVVAHELGHYVHQHHLRLFGLGTIVSLAAFYLAHVVLTAACPALKFDSPGDIATLPLFCLVIAGFAFFVRPILNAYSRRLETESDDFAVRSSTVRGSFAGALEKVSRMNLTAKEPGRLAEFLFYDHPSIAARMRRAAALERELDESGGEDASDSTDL